MIIGIILAFLIIIIFSIFWTVLYGAGWVPTPMRAVYNMLAIAEVKPTDVVYDLGSGDGRIVVVAAKEFGAKVVGIEIDPLRFIFSWVRIKLMGLDSKVELIWGDFFKLDISEASVVTLFLSQEANDKLKRKFEEELRPDARIVSFHWIFNEWESVKNSEDGEIHLYRINKLRR